jgi:antitoxin VapB
MNSVDRSIPAEEREVSLFRNGRNQAVRIPRGFELAGQRALMRREGRCLIIEPLPVSYGLAALLAGWTPLDEALPTPPDPAPQPLDIF